MTTIALDIAAFRALFPAFSNVITYPDAVIQLFWDTATNYVSDQNGGCYTQGLKLAQQTLALNQMTAHLLALNALIGNSSQTPGLKQAATIDKVSITLTPPPVPNQWQWWLSLTPYGQQLLALLQVASAGGFYYGGFPTSGAFRR